MPAQDRADLALFRNEAGRAIDGLSVGSLAREEYVRTVIVTCDHNTAAPPLAARNEVVLLLEIAAFMVNEGDPAAVEEVVQCAPCDAFRFGLFATAASVLLMLIGQGRSATETE